MIQQVAFGPTREVTDGSAASSQLPCPLCR